MAQPPAPKRRRVSGPDEADTSQPGGAKPHTLITRKADDILKATRDLHRNLDVYGDVLICACSSDGSEVELTAVSALVAASSRPTTTRDNSSAAPELARYSRKLASLCDIAISAERRSHYY